MIERKSTRWPVGLKGAANRKAGAYDDIARGCDQGLGGAQAITGFKVMPDPGHTPRVPGDQQGFYGGADGGAGHDTPHSFSRALRWVSS